MEKFLDPHVLVIRPLLSSICKPGQPWNVKIPKSGLFFAIFVVLVMATHAFKEREINLYEILEAKPFVEDSSLKASYRSVIRRHHPDLASDDDIPGLYQKIKKAHDILMNPHLKDSYFRFGDFLFKNDFNLTDVPSDYTEVIYAMLLYLFLGVCCVFFFYPKAIRQALICVFLVSVGNEIYCRFGPNSHLNFIWLPWFGSLLPFERVEFLRKAVPYVMDVISFVYASRKNEEDTLEIVSRNTLTAMNALLSTLNKLNELYEPLTSGMKKEGSQDQDTQVGLKLQGIRQSLLENHHKMVVLEDKTSNSLFCLTKYTEDSSQLRMFEELQKKWISTFFPSSPTSSKSIDIFSEAQPFKCEIRAS